jgi:hypothetical protein
VSNSFGSFDDDWIASSVRSSPWRKRGSIEKARDHFPARALNSCDDEDVLVICPTCQIFSGSFSNDRIASSLCSSQWAKARLD